MLEKPKSNKIAASLLALALNQAIPNESAKAQEFVGPLHYNHGQVVKVDDILEQQIPAEYLKLIYDQVKPGTTGVVVSKSYHLLFLISKDKKDNAEVKMKIPVGTANIDKGSRTPTGVYPINLKGRGTVISGARRSRENGELMYNTIFYNYKTGHAIHGSDNFFISPDGQMLTYWDNSHGCVNISKPDAEKLLQYLKRDHKSRYLQITITD